MAAGRGRSRRVSVPGVAELLRSTTPPPAEIDERQASGRERHDQKITVYLSAAELLDLEHARLRLRRFGVVIDRGRLVREAVAVLLADLDARGPDSLIARRARASTNQTPSHPHDQDNDDETGASRSAVPSLAWARLLAAR